tara:strand:+ start:1743 stop:3671 length:1929 start_codon:yes stop_codon:yes gene_type:complete
MTPLDSMNPAQREAITLSPDVSNIKDILIVAGAGSGKTRVVVNRIAYLMSEHRVHPGHIVGLTFTRKAAKEMSARLSSMVNAGRHVKLCTFHTLAADLIRGASSEHIEIIDDTDQKRMIKNILKEKDLLSTFKPKDFIEWLSSQRNQCIDPEVALESDSEDITLLRDIAKDYRTTKRNLGRHGVSDFDDLLEKAYFMLRDNEGIRKRIQARWRYLFVDEYQDTNTLQFRFLELLRGPRTQRCMVGDEDQLIYAWRGADIGYIMRSYFASLKSEETHCVMLNTNYRCSGSILSLANAIIAENEQRTGKELDAHKPKGAPVQVCEFYSPSEEGDFVADWIEDHAGRNIDYGEMAILVRQNRLARDVERAMIKSGTPYVMHNGVAMFDSLEVKLLMNLLLLAHMPSESFYLQGVLSSIKVGVGVGDAGFLKYAKEKPPEQDWLSFAQSHKTLSKKSNFIDLLHFVDQAGEHLASGALEIAAQFLVREMDLMRFFKEEERENRSETVNVCLQVMNDYEHEASLRNVKPNIIDFQEQRLLNDALVDKMERGAVNIMTVHKSKGLEFKAGVILGMEDGVFPSGNPDEFFAQDFEEDRRLAYVAITRFMENLLVTRSRNRVGFNTMGGFSSLLDHHLAKLEEKGYVALE